MNIIIAQSGGPTCAINSSLGGAFREAEKSERIDKVYGAFNGIEGIIDDQITDLEGHIGGWSDYELLIRTPSAVLGSCRRKLPDWKDDSSLYEIIANNLRKHDIGIVFYIGGNDSMDTVAKFSDYIANNGKDIRFIGIPKTIDNDLCCTDHSPGFGSAAKYVCTSVGEITSDSTVYSIPSVTIIETMGRHAGWLAAASCCIRANGQSTPHLIYLPEVPFSNEKFLDDIRRKMKEHMAVIAVVSEGVKTDEGRFAAEAYQSGQVDTFGHTYLSGVGKYLERLVASEIGCKVRSIELNVMQRCSSHIASLEDIRSAEAIGAAAVRAGLDGKTGVMMAFVRESNSPYKYRIETVPAAQAANSEKFFPREWITPDGNDVTADALEYFLPLIQGELSPILRNGIPMNLKIRKHT